MPFSWGQAGLVALVGFSGVFVILFVLAVALSVISAVIHRVSSRPAQEEQK